MSDDGPPPPKVLTAPQAWVTDICAVLGWNYQIRSNAGRAARLGKELRDAGGTLLELREHFGQADMNSPWWWYRDDWRGKRGQRPTISQLSECWGLWDQPIAIAPAAEPAGFNSLRAFLGASNVSKP